MVYPGDKQKEEAVGEYMAMGPERSKQLHNFTLPYLKWGNQRFLRCMKADSAAGTASGADHRLRRRSSPSRFGESSASFNSGRSETEQLCQQPELRRQHRRLRVEPSGSGGEEGIDEVRERIMLDLREVVDKMKKSILREGASEDEDEEEETEKRQIEKVKQKENQMEKKKEKEELPAAAAEEARPWNLRTRRGAASRAPIGDAGNSGLNNVNNNRGLRIEQTRVNHSPVVSDTVKSLSPAVAAMESKEMPKFSVALTKKEIEEDFMGMVGRRPPRRPKKRPRSVQKQMDTLFPGLWLADLTPDSYKVSDSADNGKR